MSPEVRISAELPTPHPKCLLCLGQTRSWIKSHAPLCLVAEVHQPQQCHWCLKSSYVLLYHTLWLSEVSNHPSNHPSLHLSSILSMNLSHPKRRYPQLLTSFHMQVQLFFFLNVLTHPWRTATWLSARSLPPSPCPILSFSNYPGQQVQHHQTGFRSWLSGKVSDLIEKKDS